MYSSFSSLLRSSVVNVLLLFNPSLIILAPSVPISLSIYFIFIIVHLSFSDSIIFHFYSSFSSPLRSSVVNVLLLFNNSLIILAPDSPILLSIYFIFIIYHLSFSTLILLSHHHSDPVQSMYYYFSILHLSSLLLLLQYC